MEWQLDDGVEIYWVVLEVEEEFGIKIHEWEEIESVGDLYRAVLERVRIRRVGEGNDCPIDETEIWNRLKALLVSQLALRPDQIVESARFCVELGM